MTVAQLRVALPALAFATLIPAQAQAHLIGVELGGFYAGLLHIFSSLDYLAALAGLNAWMALQPREDVLAPLAGGLPGLAAGAVFGATFPMWDRPEPLLLAIFCLGGMAAFVVRLRRPTGAALGAVLTFPLGLSNGTALGEGSVDVMLYTVGVVTGGMACSLVGGATLAALTDRFSIGTFALRIFGGWLMAFGIIGLALVVIGPLSAK